MHLETPARPLRLYMRDRRSLRRRNANRREQGPVLVYRITIGLSLLLDCIIQSAGPGKWKDPPTCFWNNDVEA
jgi:hypothetical protein